MTPQQSVRAVLAKTALTIFGYDTVELPTSDGESRYVDIAGEFERDLRAAGYIIVPLHKPGRLPAGESEGIQP